MNTRKVTIVKNNQRKIGPYRFYSQIFFALLSGWIGIEFFRFIQYMESNGALGSIYRPPGVEAYLPISSLMSVVYFLQTGIVHPVHPAGFLMFIGFTVVSIIAGKAFCSWICPIGYISEYAAEFGEKLFRRKIKLPSWLDYPLRSLKYLLLLFFLMTILAMTSVELKVFLESDYNKIADVKLFEFFSGMSRFSVIVLTSLFLLSILIRNFWCRYLCPYGAFFGLIGLISPVKIKRNAITCTDCGKCDRVCPSRIKIMKSSRVISDECVSCMNCIDACPVDNTLNFSEPFKGKQINKFRLMIFAAFVYIIILIAGFASGKWQSSVPATEFQKIYENRQYISH